MYIGKTPTVGNFQKCDAITTSATADYTLQVSSVNVSPESVNHMIVSLNGVIQAPTTAYTVSGATLSFASALTSADVIDFVLLLGNVLDVGTPTDNTVATAKIQDDAVTLAKMAAGTDGNIISYDASGNPVAIATGTAGHFLKSQGAGAQPVFAASSSDFVKIATVTTGSSVAEVDMEGCFTSTYTLYQLRFQRLVAGSAAYFYPVMLNASNVAMTDTYYSKGHFISGEYNSSSPNGPNSLNATTGIRLTNDNNSNRAAFGTHGTMDFFDPLLTLGTGSKQTFRTLLYGGASSSNLFWQTNWIVYQDTTTAYGGIKFKMSSGNIEAGFTATMYGIKT